MLSKKIILFFGLFSFFINGFSQTKVSNQSGGWSNAAIWTPTGVPSSTDNVVISDGHNVSIGANATCSNLTVGSGASAVLQFTGNANRTFTVGGNILINASANFSVNTSSNATHSLLLSGNLTNNGSFAMFADNNSLCNVTFNRNGNQTIGGTGTLTRFNRMTLNMGVSSSNILEITSSAFTASSDFLILNNGTFKQSGAGSSTLVPFTNAATVAATSGLWLNSSTAVLSCSANLSFSGQLTLSSGTIFVGNSNNEDLIPLNGGVLSISGGSLVVSGKYNASTAATTFSMSGGVFRISNNSSANSSIAPFHISVSGSVFNMSGGTIILPRQGGNGATDLSYVNTGATSGAVTGGTLQLGDATSPGSQNIRINSTYSVPNIVINSANVNAILSTNSLVITNNVSILSGTLSANNLNMSVGGNWVNTAGTFSPGTATVIFNSASAQSINKSGGETFNNLLFSGSGTKTFGSPVTALGNFTVASGAIVDVSSTSHSLSIGGNFVNNGSFIQQNGTVLFNGTVAQSITGTSATTFYNITLNNTAGATLGNAVSFEGTLQLNNGTLNINSQSFTLISNSAGTGRVGSIAGTGNISGNMTVQRFVPGGATGWALWGTPFSSAHSMSDWDDDIPISCVSCPDGYVNGFTSIYSYDETPAGSYSALASYVAINTINDPITTGLGYWVYVGNGQVNTTDITLDITGAIQKFNYSIPLNYSNSGSLADDGWNLITNPYPSTISWASLRGSTANLDDAIYVYNADLNSGAGSFATYVNGVSSPAVSSGGVGDNIPMGQGFYIHSTGATALQATESIKVNNNPTFLKPSLAPSHLLMRLNLNSSTSRNDETVLYFEPNATKNFEEAFDAYKMSPLDPQSPVVAINQGTVDFQINAVAPVIGSFSIPVRALAGVSGNFTISTQGLNDFPAGACITLYDKVNATSTDLRNSVYTFYLADTTNAPRFVLFITINALNASTQIQQPTCINPAQGSVVAKGLSQGPWNYYWTQNGTIIKTSLNKNDADTLQNLSGGNYELEINTVGQCDNYQSALFITAQSPVTSLFSGPDTVLLSQASTVSFTNLSQNSVGQTWFSNGQTSTQQDALFNYSAQGNYTVSLVSVSSSGCIDSTHKSLAIIDDLTGLTNSSTRAKFVVKTLGNNLFEISGTEEITTATIFDLSGRKISSLAPSDTSSLTIDLSSFHKGVYLINLLNNQSLKHSLKLIAE